MLRSTNSLSAGGEEVAAAGMLRRWCARPEWRRRSGTRILWRSLRAASGIRLPTRRSRSASWGRPVRRLYRPGAASSKTIRRTLAVTGGKDFRVADVGANRKCKSFRSSCWRMGGFWPPGENHFTSVILDSSIAVDAGHCAPASRDLGDEGFAAQVFLDRPGQHRAGEGFRSPQELRAQPGPGWAVTADSIGWGRHNQVMLISGKRRLGTLAGSGFAEVTGEQESRFCCMAAFSA